jgi:hypothetical protein
MTVPTPADPHPLANLPPLVPATLLADRVQRDVRTIRRWAKNKHLPEPLVIKRRLYFRLVDLMASPLFVQ